MTKIEATEHEIQRSILDYLEFLGIFHYRNNSGAMPLESKGVRRFLRFGTPGSPDIVIVKGGIYIGVEVKTKTGKQNPNQIQFQKDLEAAGGQYWLVRSLNDFHAKLKNYG